MSFVESMFSLNGAVAVITGGAGGLPRSLAVAFAKAGARVCLWGRGTNHPIEDAVVSVRAESGSPDVFGVTVDTADSLACERAYDATVKHWGIHPAIVLNGVGGNRGKSSFIDVDEQVFQEVLKLNLLSGLVTPTRVFVKHWIEQGIQGTVINMTSMTSYKALSGVWAYDAAKAGVLNLTEALAKELAPHHIRVNAIAPGFFVGNQNRSLLYRDDGDLTERGKAIIARTPFGRFGEHSELWGTALFLASDKASGFITGVSIPVDGGFLADNI